MNWLAGQKVRVRQRAPSGHSRVPGFIEGRIGTVQRYWGSFPYPAELAKGRRDQPAVPLYLVIFEPGELWSDAAQSGNDRVCVDVYGPDLADVDQGAGHGA